MGQENRPEGPLPFYENHPQEYIIIKTQKKQEWLSSLDGVVIDTITTRAKIEHYTRGEKLVIQGNEDDTLFMITSGSSSVFINDDQRNQIHVANKVKGDFFGEISLLAGKPITATLQADTEMDVIVLNKKSFKKLIRSNESILPILITALENNKSSLTEILEEERNKTGNSQLTARQLFMKRIKEYLMIN